MAGKGISHTGWLASAAQRQRPLIATFRAAPWMPGSSPAMANEVST
jgi:hypothetical protein